MAFSNQLPAPGALINKAGVLDNVTGEPAPGFAGVNLRSHLETQLLRSRSNRGLPVVEGGHFWSFEIQYHPMTKNMFDSLESFILGMNTRANPFYVVLPNYSSSKNGLFNTWDASNNATVSGSVFAGDTSFIVGTIANANIPYPGDLFNVVDAGDALHKNTYKVTRVETNAVYSGTQPAVNNPRIHFFPPLQRDKVGTMTLVFQNPAFRVLQRGDHEVDYDENNLVSFRMSVEEIMP